MPQYLASLAPEQTIESFFDSLYGQTAEVASAMLEIHSGEHGPLSQDNCSGLVSGTDLSFKITSGFTTVSKQIETIKIFARIEDKQYPLVSLGCGDGADRFDDPIKVEAFRDHEEGCGDYSFERQGGITARLARIGISGTEPSIPDEPYGKTIISSSTQLGKMTEEEYDRIGFIGDGIVRGIAAASLLLAGASAKDVLTLQGRHLDNSGYVHPTSPVAIRPESLPGRKYPLASPAPIAAAA